MFDEAIYEDVETFPDGSKCAVRSISRSAVHDRVVFSQLQLALDAEADTAPVAQPMPPKALLQRVCDKRYKTDRRQAHLDAVSQTKDVVVVSRSLSRPVSVDTVDENDDDDGDTRVKAVIDVELARTPWTGGVVQCKDVLLREAASLYKGQLLFRHDELPPAPVTRALSRARGRVGWAAYWWIENESVQGAPITVKRPSQMRARQHKEQGNANDGDDDDSGGGFLDDTASGGSRRRRGDDDSVSSSLSNDIGEDSEEDHEDTRPLELMPETGVRPVKKATSVPNVAVRGSRVTHSSSGSSSGSSGSGSDDSESSSDRSSDDEFGQPADRVAGLAQGVSRSTTSNVPDQPKGNKKRVVMSSSESE